MYLRLNVKLESPQRWRRLSAKLKLCASRTSEEFRSINYRGMLVSWKSGKLKVSMTGKRTKSAKRSAKWMTLLLITSKRRSTTRPP